MPESDEFIAKCIKAKKNERIHGTVEQFFEGVPKDQHGCIKSRVQYEAFEAIVFGVWEAALNSVALKVGYAGSVEALLEVARYHNSPEILIEEEEEKDLFCMKYPAIKSFMQRAEMSDVEAFTYIRALRAPTSSPHRLDQNRLKILARLQYDTDLAANKITPEQMRGQRSYHGHRGVVFYLAYFGLFDEAVRTLQVNKNFIQDEGSCFDLLQAQKFCAARFLDSHPTLFWVPNEEVEPMDKRTPKWLENILTAHRRKVIDSSEIQFFSLDETLPIHAIRFGEANFNDDYDRFNGLRASMMMQLQVLGLGLGAYPTDLILKTILQDCKELSGQYNVPIVTKADPRTGLRLVLNGHHRLAALMSLVHEGYLPQGILQKLPFIVLDLMPRALIKQQEVPEDLNKQTFSWPAAMKPYF